MSYTPGGKAMLHTQWLVHVRDEGGGIHLVADNGRYIAHFFEPKRRNVYNALRIAALWNMAERLGLSTEEIEGIASDINSEATVECFLGCPETNNLMKKYMRKQYRRTK